MKQFIELVVVIPVGPHCNAVFIADTISSIKYYLRSTHKIILADDSQKGTGLLVKNKFPDIEIVSTPRAMGKLCGLYMTLSMAFRYALDKYQFLALLRMDTDALIIGKAPEREAMALFATQPGIGMAGQYPLDYDGLPWDTSWPGGQIWKIMHTGFFFKKPVTHYRLVRHYLRARKNNYRRGESVFGGACFFSHACLMALREKGLLPQQALSTLELEEDHLFSLLVKSIGYQLGSLSGDGQSFGCAWQGLPAAPQALEEKGRKIIHSTRHWEHMKEEDIRAWFREKREPAAKGLLYLVN